MTSTLIQKYSKWSTANLKERAIRIFNKWIRQRDEGQGCISCGSFNDIQAGHYHSAGQNNHLRFNEFNVNSQCKRRNYYLSGNLIHYRANLIKKIGIEKVEELDRLASDKSIHHTDRIFIIETIEKYKKQMKKAA